MDERWVLTSYSSDMSGVTPAVDSVPFNFAFNINQQGEPTGFYGFDGCNVFSSGEVRAEGNTVTSMNGVNTDGRSCGDLQFADYLMQFDHFYTVISDSFSYDEMNDQLILTSTTRSSLLFSPCVAIDSDSLDSICEPI
jgi:heat shock protein HslJ